MSVTLDAQRSTPDARREMPVLHHCVWCDRAFCAVGGSITFGLYVECIGCLRGSGICLVLALQAALRPFDMRGERGANVSRRYEIAHLRKKTFRMPS